MGNIDGVLVECVECGYEMEASMGIKERSPGQFRCRGCVVYEKKLNERKSLYSSSIGRSRFFQEP